MFDGVTFGGLEIFMLVCAGIFFIGSVAAPIINKKSVLTIIASSFCGAVCACYFVFCVPMLTMLETIFGEASVPLDYITDKHTTFTSIFMTVLFVIAVCGVAIPIVFGLKKFKAHRTKMFNLYAIIAAVTICTLGVMICTTSKSYYNLILFLPLHLAYSLVIAAFSLMDMNKTSQFIRSLTCTLILTAVSIYELVLFSGMDTFSVIAIVLFSLQAILANAAVVLPWLKAKRDGTIDDSDKIKAVHTLKR